MSKHNAWAGMALTLLLLALAWPRMSRAQTPTVDQGVDAVEVLQATATVERLDLEKWKITLLLNDGKHKTFKVDPRVQNLDQVEVGDHLKISFTEEIVILIGKSDQAVGAAEGTKVSLNPKGASPSVVRVDTSALSAKVLAVDSEKRRVTLIDPDGKKKTIKLSKNVTNLDQLKVGETIDMVMTDSLVVEVMK